MFPARPAVPLTVPLTVPLRPHLHQHLDARDPLEGQQQEGHEGQPLAARGLLQTRDHGCELRVLLPEDSDHTLSMRRPAGRRPCVRGRGLHEQRVGLLLVDLVADVVDVGGEVVLGVVVDDVADVGEDHLLKDAIVQVF